MRSSPRYGLSTPYRLTIRNRARLFHHVLFNMGYLHLVLPALNLNLSTLKTGEMISVFDYSNILIMSTLNAGILIMMEQVRLLANSDPDLSGILI